MIVYYVYVYMTNTVMAVHAHTELQNSVKYSFTIKQFQTFRWFWFSFEAIKRAALLFARRRRPLAGWLHASHNGAGWWLGAAEQSPSGSTFRTSKAPVNKHSF